MGEEEKESVSALIPRPLLPRAGEGEIVGCENRTFRVRAEITGLGDQIEKVFNIHAFFRVL